MTTINEALTPLADGFRNLYGTTDKYSIVEMDKLLSGLQIHNLLDDGQYFDTTKGDSNYKVLNGLDLATWQKYVGRTLLISFDVNWSGYKNDSSINNRTGIEYGIKFKNSPELWFSAWLYPDSPSGSKHIYTFYTLLNDEVTEIEEGNYFNQLNGEAVVKATNLKIVVNPLEDRLAPLDLFNPDLTTWGHSNIEIFSENGYKVATLPPDNSQLQTNINWEQNKTYRWTFEAKADYSGDIIHTEMWGGSGGRDIELVTNWKQYSTFGIPNLKYNNFYFWNSSNHGNVYLRNIRIYEV